MTTSKFAKTKYLIGVVKTVIHESGDQGCLSNWNEKKKKIHSVNTLHWVLREFFYRELQLHSMGNICNGSTNNNEEIITPKFVEMPFSNNREQSLKLRAREYLFS